jgi:hypothetical protein
LHEHEIEEEEEEEEPSVEEEEGPCHIDEDAIPYQFSTSTIPSGYTSPSSSSSSLEEEEESHSLLEEEEEESLQLEILADNIQKEEDRYAVLSRAPNVLINLQVDSQYRNGDPEWTPWSSNMWELLESLALPASAAFLALFVRHCMFVVLRKSITTASVRPACVLPFDTLDRSNIRDT